MSFMRDSLTFLYSLGMFDVILPFLLIFVLAFAVLERTKILGTIKLDGETYSKKNLDALAAFTLAFLVIGSAKLVSFLVSFASTMVVILVIILLLIILNATLYGYSGSNDEFKLSDLHKKIMFWMIFVSILVVIFMLIPFKSFLLNQNVILLKQAMTSLSYYVSPNVLTEMAYSLFVFGFIGFSLWLILRNPSRPSKNK